MHQRILFLITAWASVPMTAVACGACIEDQIAATYDHAVMTQAAAQHQVVVFAAVDRNGGATPDVREVRRAAAAAKGVVAGSVRVSGEPSALSFALDANARGPERTLADIQSRLRATHVTLKLLRVTS